MDYFGLDPQSRWAYVSDQVMGGVSEGTAEFLEKDGESYVRLTGDVSVDNNGGFIQVRTRLPEGLPEDVKGVALKVLGNGQRYFVHLRTTGTMLPWQYYQASFDAMPEWREVRIPLEAFEPSGRMLGNPVMPQSIRSVGIVAYGRAHRADVSVASVEFY